MTGPPTPPVALTIAGSDSGGGAGIQADLKMFAALGVFGTSAVTAVTAQNTLGVSRVDVLAVDAVAAQIDAVVSDLRPDAAKTGMLAVAETIVLVAERAASGALPPLVVDPVMVASSGDRLLDQTAEAAYRDHLFPHALAVTPNRREAEVLLGRPLRTTADMRAGAAELAEDGPGWVVITGGHLDGEAVDVVHETATGRVTELRTARIPTANVHGTGCSFAAAVTAGLARGDEPARAISAAKATVAAAIAGAADWCLGGGHGPIDHFGWSAGTAPPIDIDTYSQERP